MILRYQAALCLAGVAMAGTIGASGARADDDVVKPLTLRLGVVYPQDSDKSSTHFAVGFSYESIGKKSEHPLLYGFYADYLAQSSKTTYSDPSDSVVRKTSGFGVGGTVRYLFSPIHGSLVKRFGFTHYGFTPYVGAGLGIYNDYVKKDINRFGVGSSEYADITQIGGKVMAGTEFKTHYLVEAVYQFFPENNDSKIGGFGLNAGYRF